MPLLVTFYDSEILLLLVTSTSTCQQNPWCTDLPRVHTVMTVLPKSTSTSRGREGERVRGREGERAIGREGERARGREG